MKILTKEQDFITKFEASDTEEAMAFYAEELNGLTLLETLIKGNPDVQNAVKNVISRFDPEFLALDSVLKHFTNKRGERDLNALIELMKQGRPNADRYITAGDESFIRRFIVEQANGEPVVLYKIALIDLSDWTISLVKQIKETM